jgi:predicted transcriptional regulator/transcriptional regulator with XRE-family HTH domain
MSKAFMGVRLRWLREERRLTQAELAQTLAISTSYMSQLEKNQRPLTVPLLIRLNTAFGVDIQLFSNDEEAHLIAGLRETLSETSLAEPIALAEIRELASNMPSVARALIGLHRRYRIAIESPDIPPPRPGGGGSATALQSRPIDQVRDLFYDPRHNYIAELDEAAEQLYQSVGLAPGILRDRLAYHLRHRLGVRVTLGTTEEALLRQYDPDSRALHISRSLKPGQQAFQLGVQLAFLEHGALIDTLLTQANFISAEARQLGRLGLAAYFASALVLPYTDFLQAAETYRYDIGRLGRHFGVGFETVCQRLSAMQRPGAAGVPFFFVRVDRAGNISKRQSATEFRFSRFGGACPLWNVFEAFERPGQIITQISQMPDGPRLLWIARTVARVAGVYGAPRKVFSIGLACDLRDADRLIYSTGLDLTDPEAATPIGAGCKVCDRPACPQRAMPPTGRPLAINENESRFAPYPFV